MADKRGEVLVAIDGTEHTMRLTFAAALRLEKRVGSLIKLAERMTRGDVTIEEIVDVLHAGITAGGTKMERDALGDAVMSAGIMAYCKTAAELVVAALTGGGRKESAEDIEKKA